jgi:hypothetical protein
MSDKLYGNPPVDLGLIDICPTEMMFWLYCPIKVPCRSAIVPPNLKQFMPIIEAVYSDHAGDERDAHRWQSSYVYITAKRLFVSPDNPGNRPGWHADGFMTADLNYVWYDGNPTIFWEPKALVPFTQDDRLSLDEMQAVAGHWTQFNNQNTYPNKHLLKLDETVIHRVADVTAPGFRTFVKVSVSTDRYALSGNSINHELGLDWQYADRSMDRNQPNGGAS